MNSIPIRQMIVVLWMATATSKVFAASTSRLLQSVTSLNATCFNDDQCPADVYCLKTSSYGRTGSCRPCWQCCLFPNVYGNCPARCNCNVAIECSEDDAQVTCGEGLFCASPNYTDVAVCQSCSECIDLPPENCATCEKKPHRFYAACNTSCPSAKMSLQWDSSSLIAKDEFLFLSFLAYDIIQQRKSAPDDGDSTLLRTDLATWLGAEGVPTGQVALAVDKMVTQGEESVRVPNWMEAVGSRTSTALICPEFNPRKQPTLSMLGCSCNTSMNPQAFRCPSGGRCSSQAFNGLSSEGLRNPTAERLRAVCVRCEAGQYCPEGTYVQDETQLAILDCPSGYFCPDPATKIPCPPGSFCTVRSTDPTTCDMEYLLSNEPARQLNIEPETVISRVRAKRDPTTGNYCPAKSTKPNEVCSPGYFCPNVSSKLICPRGYYCKAQSTAPWKCPLLTRCPEGTAVPGLSYMALVVAGIVLASIPLIHTALNKLDNSIIMEADGKGGRDAHSAAASRMTFRLLKSINLNQSPVEHKYRGFGQVSPLITLEFDSLGLQIRPRGGEVKNVLSGVSGAFSPRRLNAILGPSGCGKTTFLNVLCGKTSSGVLMGKVLVNGEHAPVTRIKKIMGFVPQDDIVHEDLTVRENLNYSARMRLPSDLSRSRRRDVVQDALEMLGLSAIQHYRVGTVERRGISGGQRKRVNIGLELVAMPSLLFLDEPTSGLDATSSADILSSLVDMANLGMNVIAVIHQPRFSSFLMFDQVLLLGNGGFTVYLGSPSAAMLYFTKYLGYTFPDRENPSDILMDIIAGKVPCVGDPRLKTCTQLVDKWTSGGMAWVETLEALNPTMVTKLSEVDPAIILAIDEQFDMLDVHRSGLISATQLVQLFGNLGQEISEEDAVILIRKLNAARPASSRRPPYRPLDFGVTISGNETDEDDGTGTGTHTISKRQLLDAFQGVREGNDDAGGEVNAPNNAAAKFYASQFLLPDLPEVKTYRENIERRLKNGACANSNGMSPIDTASDGSGSESDDPAEHLDSDSYSPMGTHWLRTAGGPSGDEGGKRNGSGGGAFATPLVESMLQRSILSLSPRTWAGNNTGSGAAGCSTIGSGGGGLQTVRSAALLPGLAQNRSLTSVVTIGRFCTAAPGRPGSAAAAPPGAGAADGTEPVISGGEASDGTSGDLTAYAARHRRRQQAQFQKQVSRMLGEHRRRQASTGEGSDTVTGEEEAGGEEDGGSNTGPQAGSSSMAAVAGARAGGSPRAESSADPEGGMSVAPGLMATSLGAMKLLADADVPLPQLPRRAADCWTRSLSARPSKVKSDMQAYNAIAAYVNTYNDIAATQVAAAAARRASTVVGASNSLDADDEGDNVGRKRSATIRSAGRSRKNSRIVQMGSGETRLPEVELRLRPSSVSLQMKPPSACPALLHFREEEDESEVEAGASGTIRTESSLPPLLQQLLNRQQSSSTAAHLTATVSVAEPVAEGRERGNSGTNPKAGYHNPTYEPAALAATSDSPTRSLISQISSVACGTAAPANQPSPGSRSRAQSAVPPLDQDRMDGAISPRAVLGDGPSGPPAGGNSGSIGTRLSGGDAAGGQSRSAPQSPSRSPHSSGLQTDSARATGTVDNQPHGSLTQSPFAVLLATSRLVNPEGGLVPCSSSNLETKLSGSRALFPPHPRSPPPSRSQSMTRLSGPLMSLSSTQTPAAVPGGYYPNSPLADTNGSHSCSSAAASCSGGSAGLPGGSVGPWVRPSRHLTVRTTRFARSRRFHDQLSPCETPDMQSPAGHLVELLAEQVTTLAPTTPIAGVAGEVATDAVTGAEAGEQRLSNEDSGNAVGVQEDEDQNEGQDVGSNTTARHDQLIRLRAAEAGDVDESLDRSSAPCPRLKYVDVSMRMGNSTSGGGVGGVGSGDRVSGGGGRGSGGGSSRPRRASLNLLGSRRQRRQSWAQNSEGESEEASTPNPGGTRKARKDTLYVNNLLSSALVGAWAATQSSATGRNSSMTRLSRPMATLEGGGSNSGVGGSVSSTRLVRGKAQTTNSLARSNLGHARSGAMGGSSAALGLTPQASSSPVAAVSTLNSSLTNRFDMEEVLATRKGQGFVVQLTLLLRRGFIKYVRSFWPMRVVDSILQLAAAFIIGLVHGTRWSVTSVPSNSIMCMVCLGVLSCVTHVRTFSINRVLLWRESASGMSTLAYFLSQNILDLLWVLAAPGLSLSVYYYLTLPRMPFGSFWLVGLFVCWWASGVAYLVSSLLPPQNVLMAAVFTSLIFGAFLNGLTYTIAAARSTFLEGVMGLSYNRWAMEIVSLNEFRYYQSDSRNTLMLLARSIGLCGVDTKLQDDGQDGVSADEAISFLRLQSEFSMDYCDRFKSAGFMALFALGLGFRILAYGLLRYSCVKRH